MRNTGIIFQLFFLFISSIGIGQTVLIDSLQEGGFSLGSSFAANGWTVLNGTATNAWYVGAAPGIMSGDCAYISNNSGTTWSYTNNASAKTTHFYRNVVLPQGINYLELSFSWVNAGEVAPNDVLMVSIAPTTYTPSQTNTTAVILSKPAQTLVVLNNQSSVKKQRIYFHPQVINTCSATDSFRLIFSFRYNNTQGSNPPAALDNISLILHPSPVTNLGGEFTVNKGVPESSSNFTLFSKAIASCNAASQCLMMDSVVLNVPGSQTFEEDLPWITFKGTSNAGLIIRQSTAGLKPVIQPMGSSWNRDFGIGLSGAKYVTIENIDVRVNPSNANVEYGFFIKPDDVNVGSQNNKFSNGSIVLNKANTQSVAILQTTNSNITGFTITAQTGTNSWNEFKGLKIENAAQGILFQGSSASFYDEGNKIGSSSGLQMFVGGEASNDMGGNLEVHGIYASYQKNILIEGTTVRNFYTNGAFNIFGIRLVECVGTIKINRNNVNKLNNLATNAYGTVAGIYTSGSAASTTYTLTNNFVSDINLMYSLGYNTQFTSGCFLNHSGSINYLYFNSIVIAPVPNLSSAALYSVSGQAYLKNNIFINNSLGNNPINNRYSINLGSSTLVESNYNCMKMDMFGMNTYLVRSSSGVNYSDLNAWKSASGKDLNSLELNPDFISSSDLHIQNNSFKIDGKGTHIPGMLIDIDGNPRDTIAPDIGADDHMPVSNGIDIGVYGIKGIDNLNCFGNSEQVSVRLINTGINPHNFSSNPVEIQLTYSGAYSGMVSYVVSNGVLNSYEDTSVLMPNLFNFSGGGTISFTCNLIVQADVNPLNNVFTKVFSQEPVIQNFSENFNSLSALPTNWTFAQGWSIATQAGTLSKSLGIILNSNSSSELILPIFGLVGTQDSFAFDLMARESGSWKSVQIDISTDCGISYLPFDTMQSTAYPTKVKWHHYKESLLPFVGNNLKIKLKVNSLSYQTIILDNFNVEECLVPVHPTNLVINPVTINSINLTFIPSGADGYMVVRYPAGAMPGLYPENGVIYANNTALGNGTIISYGPSTNISVTGLAIGTQYDFYVFPYYGITCGGGPRYNSINPLWGTQSTYSCSGSGIYTIGSSNDHFNSVAAAWLQLKNIGVLDTVYLELQTDYVPEASFTFTSVGCADSSHVIIVRPAADVVNPISSVASTGSFTSNLEFNGVSGLIIDGRPGGNGSQNYLKFIANNAPTVVFNSGSKFITLKNVDLQGGLQSLNDGLLTFNSAQKIVIQKCTIGNPNSFVPVLMELNSSFRIDIKDNNFRNFSNTGIAHWDPNNCLIEGNSFYFSIPYNNVGVGIKPIYCTGTNNVKIINNYIGGSAPQCQGDKMSLNNISSSASNGCSFTGIEAGGIHNKDSVMYNKIQNIKIYTGFGTGIFNGIRTIVSSNYIQNNIIGSEVDTSSIEIDITNSVNKYYFNGISYANSYLSYYPTIKIKKNIVANVKCDDINSMDFNFKGIDFFADIDDPSSFIDSNSIYNIRSKAYGSNFGIYCNKSNLSTFYAQYNSISGNYINNNSFTTGSFKGIYLNSRNYYTLVDNNTISNILTGDSTLSTINGTIDFAGIEASGRVAVSGNVVFNIKYVSQWNRTGDIYGLKISDGLSVPGPYSARNNWIYNIDNTSAAPEGRVSGIYMESAYFKLINNRIYINVDSSPVSKVYGIRASLGHKICQNNTIFLKGTRNNGAVTTCIYFDGATASGNVSNNILVNKCSSTAAGRLFYCLGGSSTTVNNSLLSLYSNLYYYYPTKGGICKFPGTTSDDMTLHLDLFPGDSSSFYANTLFSGDTISLIPSTGSLCEGAGIGQEVTYDCFNNERTLLSPQDIGAVAGNYYESNLDLSIKSKIKKLSCDSIQVQIHVKNVSSTQINFQNTEAFIELINQGKSGSSMYSIQLNNEVLDPLDEDTLVIILPVLSAKDTAKITSRVICIYDTQPNNNEHVVEYTSFLQGAYITVGRGGDFSTLTEAVKYYNFSKCLEENITYVLLDTIYNDVNESFPIVFNRDNHLDSINLKISPKRGIKVKIQSLLNLSSPLLLFKDVKSIEIDGVDTTGATSLSLLSSSTTQPVIHFISKARKVLLNNLIIKGNNQTNLGLVRLDTLTSTKAKLYFDRCIIEPFSSTNMLYAFALNLNSNRNNGFMQISNCQLKDYLSSGIYAPTSTWDSIFILGNSFISDKTKSNTLHPIHISYAGKLKVIGNLLGNHRTTGIYRGIYINEVTNAHISKNTIRNVNMPGTSNSLTGIHMEFMPNLACDNNMISLSWTGNQLGGVQGIFCNITQICSLINNTVLLMGSTSSSVETYSLSINKTNVLGYLRNNILFNNTTSLTGQRVAFRYNLPLILDSDNNVFIGKGTTAQNIFLHNGVYYDLAGWQAQPFQPDQHSYAHIIGTTGGGLLNDYFGSAANLHIVNGANNTKNRGIPVPGFNQDIDNNIRSVSAIDIGADEFTDSCSFAFIPIISVPDSFFCNGEEALVLSNASDMPNQMGQTYKWQYKLNSNVAYFDVKSIKQSFDTLNFKLSLADTVFIRLYSECIFNGSDTTSNIVTLYRQSNKIFAEEDSIFGSLRKGVECAEFGDTLWVDAQIDTIDVRNTILLQKKISIIDDVLPSTTIVAQSLNTADDKEFKINRSGDVLIKGLQFDGYDLDIPIFDNNGKLTLYDVLMKNSMQKIKLRPLSKLIIDGNVEILD